MRKNRKQKRRKFRNEEENGRMRKVKESGRD